MLALVVTPGDAPERAKVNALAHQIQDVTGQAVELAYVDQGYTGVQPAQAAAAHGIQLRVVKLLDGKQGFVPAQRAETLGGSPRFPGGGAQLRLDDALSPPGPRL